MATRYQQGGGQPLPLALIAQAIPRLSRHDLEALAERLIDHLDMADAPTEDMEEDDPAGQCDEDELSCVPGYWIGNHGLHYANPGCPISDPGEHYLG